ncbi:hypothetical protein ABZX74_15315 [Streptomyces olivaceoviridis]|uniref:hypothetical protein n=1 Tax=Streptomyces olivaceoviridis TaxID=1921 RepID=UPI0033B69DB7
MSQHPVRFLTCDKPLCTARFVHDGWTTKQLVPLSTLRQAARQQGWKRTPGNRDYCPAHNPWPGVAAWATATPTGGTA